MMTPPVILTRAILKSAIRGILEDSALVVDCFTIHRFTRVLYQVTYIDRDTSEKEVYTGYIDEIIDFVSNTLAIEA